MTGWRRRAMIGGVIVLFLLIVLAITIWDTPPSET